MDKIFSFDSAQFAATNSCSTDSKGSACCSGGKSSEDKNLKDHWNKIFDNSASENLEWYEEQADESLYLLNKCQLTADASFAVVGAGTSVFIKNLIDQNHTNICACDISSAALAKLSSSLDENQRKHVKFIEDDLTNSVNLEKEGKFDFWQDRAVMHFFNKEQEIKNYFDLVQRSTKIGSYVMLAPFNKLGTDRCSGLQVNQYDIETLTKRMGSNFELIESFDHVYTSPKGNKKNFIYALFKRTL